jgi:fucose permease
MAAGRFAGDRLVARLGPHALLRRLNAVAAGGLAIALLTGQPAAAVAGFGLVGLGISNAIPVFFSAAARVARVPPGIGLAAVATTGYLGFLAGPPLIGLVAEVSGLAAALAIVAALCGVIAVCVKSILPVSEAPAGESLAAR